ncbi:MAG: PepSY domain-containing protein [Bacteroidaceae bacterium]|nr:PepSY domain-containing protein [Bacteroidaceae bacterium]
MRNIFKKLHLWVSIPFGLVITVSCFTGALLIFEEEITAACRGDVMTVSPQGEPLSFERIAQAVEATLSDDVEITGIVVPAAPNEAYKVNLSKPKRAALYVNQYTGEIKGESGRLPFFATVFRLHRWLLDTNPGDGAIFWGKMIVGASTLSFVIILVTGLVIWWPRNRKMLKNRLSILFCKGCKRLFYDLHVAGGFYALLLLLVMALTGLTWSFEWYRNGVNSLFGVEEAAAQATKGEETEQRSVKTQAVCINDCSRCVDKPCQGAKNNTAIADGNSGATELAADGNSGATELVETTKATHSRYARWQKAYGTLVAELGTRTMTVSAGTISVPLVGWGNSRAADKYSFDESNGELTTVRSYAEAQPREKLQGWVYTLHVSSWGGLFSRILGFLAALLGATLPLTGYYFWIKRLYGKRTACKRD